MVAKAWASAFRMCNMAANSGDSGMFDRETLDLSERVLDLLRTRGRKLAIAESCTGGLVAAALTEIPGSSDVVLCGFVTYSNEAKQDMLGVRDETLANHGAVSKETAGEMAEGALVRSGADVSVSITGVAGPNGGTAQKPVGLVHFAAARGAETIHEERRFGPLPRGEIRRRSTLVALELLLRAAQAFPAP
jgi:nicotinamide-nucleotide amidase